MANEENVITRVEVVRALSATLRTCNRILREGRDTALGLDPVHALTMADMKRLGKELGLVGIAFQRTGKAEADERFDMLMSDICSCQFTLRYLHFIHVDTLSQFLREVPEKLSDTLVGAENDLGAKRQYHLHALAKMAQPDSAKDGS